jgi:predicted nucleic acid-binding protein
MRVIVDTSIWSEAFRRKGRSVDAPAVRELNALIEDHRIVMLGPIRQELLSGVRSKEAFESLRKALRAFPDYELRTEDYETAAEFFNKCKSKGIQGSFIDFLISAAAARAECQIYTNDQDFQHYQRLLPITLYSFPAR